jgi:guanosine-3',5'-bis(diphosphate) 3'-pyrophosphohydrolase
MDVRGDLMTPRLERALRWAAECHQGHCRKGSATPYVEHLMGVALILDRVGFDEDVIIAGLLHDAMEDAEVTREQISERFGVEVTEIVEQCSETKLDGHGRKRPWIDRKRDHLEAVAGATVAARAVLLADKLHNLVSIEVDLRDGRPVWSLFNADRAQVLWYYGAMIDRLDTGAPRLEALAARCREALATVAAFEVTT